MITMPTTRSRAGVPRSTLRAAALAYPAVWVAGLALGSGPALDATSEAVSAHYVGAAAPSAAQSVLVHGVAAAALLVVGLALVGAARAEGARSARLAAGALGLVVVASLAQMALGLIAAARGADAGLASTAFTAIGRLDGLKMLGLAVLVAVGTRLARHGALPGWLAPLGASLVAVLAVSAAGYALLSPALALAAVVGLPLLLVWVCAAGLALSGR